MITGKEYLKKHIGETNIPKEHYENEIGEIMDWYADYYHQEQVKNLSLSGVVVPKGTLCVCKGSGGIRMDGTCARCDKQLELADDNAQCTTTYTDMISCVNINNLNKKTMHFTTENEELLLMIVEKFEGDELLRFNKLLIDEVEKYKAEQLILSGVVVAKPEKKYPMTPKERKNYELLKSCGFDCK